MASASASGSLARRRSDTTRRSPRLLDPPQRSELQASIGRDHHPHPVGGRQAPGSGARPRTPPVRAPAGTPARDSSRGRRAGDRSARREDRMAYSGAGTLGLPLPAPPPRRAARISACNWARAAPGADRSARRPARACARPTRPRGGRSLRHAQPPASGTSRRKRASLTGVSSERGVEILDLNAVEHQDHAAFAHGLERDLDLALGIERAAALAPRAVEHAFRLGRRTQPKKGGSSSALL